MMAGILIALAAYLVCGFVFAVPFVLAGVKRIDPHAAHGSWGFRVLVIPGTVFLWPLLAKRWFSGATETPEQNDAHRRAARNADCQSAVSQAGSLRANGNSNATEEADALPTASRRNGRVPLCATVLELTL